MPPRRRSARNMREGQVPNVPYDMGQYPEEVRRMIDEDCYNACEQYPSYFRIDFGEDGYQYVDRFIEVSGMTIRPTRYYDESCAEALGIKEDVEELFDRIGWKNILRIRKPTYESLVYEFFSTVQGEENEHGIPVGISFRLGNRDRYLTRIELSALFETRPVTQENSMAGGEYFDEIEFWIKIAGVDEEDTLVYDPSRSKASQIRNPVFRYVQRVLAQTIFARHEIGSVRLEELQVMSRMTRGMTSCLGKRLIDQFVRQRRPLKNIQIGGLITHIAEHFGWQPNENEQPLEGELRLDLMAMVRSRMIVRNRNTYSLKLEPDGLFPLPKPELTTVLGGDLNNWHLSSQAHNDWRNSSGGDLVRGKKKRSEGESSRGANAMEEDTEQQPHPVTEERHSFPHFSSEQFQRDPVAPEMAYTYTRRPDMQHLLGRLENLQVSVDANYEVISRIEDRMTGIEQWQAQLDGRLIEQLELQDNIRQNFRAQEEMLRNQERMQKAMYDWHVSQGHFPPLDPPPPY